MPLCRPYLLALALSAFGCASCSAGLPKQRPPGECDEARTLRITAECGARRLAACPGMPEDQVCPDVDAECDALLDKECPTDD